MGGLERWLSHMYEDETLKKAIIGEQDGLGKYFHL